MARHPKLGILHPASILIFAGLVALWLLVWLIPGVDNTEFRVAARICGYLGAGAMFVPYVHIVRRWFRHRDWGNNLGWLKWHLGAAYLAFFFVLIHSRGHGATPLTLVLQVLLWIVMVSGVVGFYGQKLLYYVLPGLIEQEYGRERLEPQRRFFLEQARVRITEVLIRDWKSFATRVQEKNSPLLASLADGLPDAEREHLQAAVRMVNRQTYKTFEEEIEAKSLVARSLERALANPGLWKPEGPRPPDLDADFQKLLQRDPATLTAVELRGRNHTLLEALYPAEMTPTKPVVRHFCETVLHDCFERPFRFRPALASDALTENRYVDTTGFAEPTQREALAKLWRLVEERRQLDLEYRLHLAGRLWLLFHGPAAWALLVLMIEHIVMSIWYGGF